MNPAERSKYATTLSELEASAHVPLDQQVTLVPDTQAPDLLTPDERERLHMLRVAAG